MKNRWSVRVLLAAIVPLIAVASLSASPTNASAALHDYSKCVSAYFEDWNDVTPLQHEIVSLVAHKTCSGYLNDSEGWGR